MRAHDHVGEHEEEQRRHEHRRDEAQNEHPADAPRARNAARRSAPNWPKPKQAPTPPNTANTPRRYTACATGRCCSACSSWPTERRSSLAARRRRLRRARLSANRSVVRRVARRGCARPAFRCGCGGGGAGARFAGADPAIAVAQIERILDRRHCCLGRILHLPRIVRHLPIASRRVPSANMAERGLAVGCPIAILRRRITRDAPARQRPLGITRPDLPCRHPNRGGDRKKREMVTAVLIIVNASADGRPVQNFPHRTAPSAALNPAAQNAAGRSSPHWRQVAPPGLQTVRRGLPQPPKPHGRATFDRSANRGFAALTRIAWAMLRRHRVDRCSPLAATGFRAARHVSG